MQSQRNRLLIAALAALLVLAHSDPVLARAKKSGSSSDMGLQRDASGTPIIMKGYRSAPRQADTLRSRQKFTKSVRIPRGSSTYIPPPMPSASQAGATTGQTVQPYNPPKITTFSDRVTNAIHSYPLQKGIGNNPTDQQMYIRQKSN
jgi:hypothetical protein